MKRGKSLAARSGKCCGSLERLPGLSKSRRQRRSCVCKCERRVEGEMAICRGDIVVYTNWQFAGGARENEPAPEWTEQGPDSQLGEAQKFS